MFQTTNQIGIAEKFHGNHVSSNQINQPERVFVSNLFVWVLFVMASMAPRQLHHLKNESRWNLRCHSLIYQYQPEVKKNQPFGDAIG